MEWFFLHGRHLFFGKWESIIKAMKARLYKFFVSKKRGVCVQTPIEVETKALYIGDISNT
jgi:hypothetical protein